MLRTPAGSWNIGQEIVHLLWAYGQDDHAFRKTDLSKWDGKTFYSSFFRLDEEAKGFQVIPNFFRPCWNLYLPLMYTLTLHPC